jgi:hypothetical protein
MSFTDLMSSGRGPGVIGMLLALLVLAGFGALFMFAFDDRLQGGARTIESQIAEQERDIQRMEIFVSNGRKSLDGAGDLKLAAKEMAGMKRANQDRESRIGVLKRELQDGKDAIVGISNEFAAYKDDYRTMVRGNAKDEVLERLETRDGKVFENVTVREVTAVGMQIRHSDGFKRIPFEDLGDDMQERFQFDPKQKEDAIAAEAAERMRHEAAVSATHEKVAEVTARQREQAEQEQKEKNVRAIALLESRAESLSNEIESLEQAIVAERYKSISRAPQMRAELAAKQRSLSAMRAEAARLRANL